MTKIFTEDENRRYLAKLPKKPIASKIVIRSTEGNVLLVKPNYKNVWQLPGGAVDAKEDPKSAAIREAKEELGVDLDPTELKVIDTIFKQDEDILIVVYEYKIRIRENSKIIYPLEELEGYKYVNPEYVGGLLDRHYYDFWESYI